MAENHCLRFLGMIVLCTFVGCFSPPEKETAIKPVFGKSLYRKTQPVQFHYPPLDLDAIKPLFPYARRKTFRISDTISLKTKLNWGLFHQIFQEVADPPPHHHYLGDHPRTSFLEVGEDYLYTYLENVSEDFKPIWKFDIVTVYSKRPGKSCIYYLPYDSEDNIDDLGRRPKGVLSSVLLSPTLAEWQETDTATTEIFSEFLLDDWLMRTFVHHSFHTGVTDSVIQIFNLNFYDFHTIYDEAKYRNGIEIEAFSDLDLRKRLHY